MSTEVTCHRGHPLESCPFWEHCTAVKLSVSALDKRLRDLRCVISQRPHPSLHHLRGGSVKLTPWGSPGAGQKQNEALKLPLHADYHFGQFGIDARINGGAESWENQFGRQIDLLSGVSSSLNVCLWGLAWAWTPWKARQLVLRRFQPNSSKD